MNSTLGENSCGYALEGNLDGQSFVAVPELSKVVPTTSKIDDHLVSRPVESPPGSSVESDESAFESI